MKEKFITTNELANDASKVLKELKKDNAVVVLRYSKPVGAIISYEDFKKIENLENSFVHECKACLVDAKKSLRRKK